MKTFTQEWVTKAENDWRSLHLEMGRPDYLNTDDICFHAQQCVEKYLKARLQEASIVFLKTHNLIVLLDLALPSEPQWEELRPDLSKLTDYGVDFRYPGRTATQEEAEEAARLCATIRAAVRPSLGLSE